MIKAMGLFAKQILGFGGFKATNLPRKVIPALLTAFSALLEEKVVILKPVLKMVKRLGKGILVIDDTSNPKYGLKRWSRKIKILHNSGYESGYKILLFMWECNRGRFPIGFALWHRESKRLNELVLDGLSLLRNRYAFQPEAVVADGAFSTDKILQRLENYGWPVVMRIQRNRKLSESSVKTLIARGYGEAKGFLKNGVKIKIFRRKSRFFGCNRMLWTMKKAIALYKRRWAIEETFRTLKTYVGLKGCQQHSMRAQALYLFVTLTLFACLQIVSPLPVHFTLQTVIINPHQVENILQKAFFTM